jgi:hypothetical protein
MALTPQSRCNSEAGKPNAVGVVDEYIFRLDVLMCEAMAMDLSECRRQSDSDTERALQIERLSLA